MDICLCEIEKRWPASSQPRIAMMEELVRRGLLTVRGVHQHGRVEAVWSIAKWRQVQ